MTIRVVRRTLRRTKKGLTKGSYKDITKSFKKGLVMRSHPMGSGSLMKPVNQNTPPFKFTKLDYVQRKNAVLTASVPTVYQFNTNSTYDPDRTGTGHQPYGYDEHVLDYKNTIVYKAYFMIEFTADADCYVVIRDASWNLNVPTDIDLESERPNAKRYIFTAGGNPLRIKYNVDVARTFGVTQAQYQTLLNLFGEEAGVASCAQPCIVNIMIQGVIDTSTPAIKMNTKIQYSSKWIMRNLRASS